MAKAGTTVNALPAPTHIPDSRDLLARAVKSNWPTAYISYLSRWASSEGCFLLGCCLFQAFLRPSQATTATAFTLSFVRGSILTCLLG